MKDLPIHITHGDSAQIVFRGERHLSRNRWSLPHLSKWWREFASHGLVFRRGDSPPALGVRLAV